MPAILAESQKGERCRARSGKEQLNKQREQNKISCSLMQHINLIRPLFLNEKVKQMSIRQKTKD